MILSSAGRRGLRLCLVALAAAATAIPLLMLRRFPTPFPDVELYASIARARQLYGVGIPTMTWNSPVAVDHIPFYGPVFFDLCALALDVLGVGLWSLRIVSVIGAGLFVLGTSLLAWQFTKSRDRTLLAVGLALTTPEVNVGMAAGGMDMLTVGFEILALALFVRGFDRRGREVLFGAAAGVLLGLAALTTTRSYPFICAFMCVGLVPAILGTSPGTLRRRVIAALVVFLTWMSAWAVISHGSVTAWLRYLSFIFTHEDTDVAILPTAERILGFHWSGMLTPAVVVLFGIAAAWRIRRRRKVSGGAAGGPEVRQDGAFTLVLACAWMNLIAATAVLNYTFTNTAYVALPMFAVLVSWPWAAFNVSRRSIAIAVTLVLVAQITVVVSRYTLLWATWAAHDPERLNAFVARFVPEGSAVVGPEAPYFVPVERAGARYRAVSPRSLADWARWVPVIEPAATQVARQFSDPPPRDRFLIWGTGLDVPDNYRCALGTVVATSVAPSARTWWPAWIVRAAGKHPGYASATLYRLPPGCPSGYDPTRPR